jgi:uncharacterized protein YyaL (SSP411 family)
MVKQYTYTNRLIHEKSPYLLQHAHNPVDWYPWGEEAFSLARLQDKPIFLSIGYATCHWCHVMERESFTDPDVAKILNRSFVNIKVDREEFPEVDSLYMEFAQGMMTGATGWPLNVILTPTLKPFFSATYLPPYSKDGFMGLIDLIEQICQVWEGEERETLLGEATRVVEIFAENVHVKGVELPAKEILQIAADILFRGADPIYGGIMGSPKFPVGYHYNFLLRHAAYQKDNRAYFLAERSLNMMSQGGIYDHLGGGFSRYSVDERWLIPHFEKMLYDNALLADAYFEAWQATKNSHYRMIGDEVLNYILRDMTHPEGGGYSAQDADSEGKEGLYYTWTPQEIESLLGKKPAELFCAFFGVTPQGNFEGRTVLHIEEPIESFALKHDEDPVILAERLGGWKHQLWLARNARIPPLKDDKILTTWNGLMIHAMANAGRSFHARRYLNAAVKAARFIQKNLWKGGSLLRRWREGRADYAANLDDHVFLIRGLLTLFEAEGNVEWLEWAMQLTEIVRVHFKEEDGAFYQTDEEQQYLLLRSCLFPDGAEPSGNSVHCENLLRLYQITWDASYLEAAKDILRAVKKYLDIYAPGYCYHLMNLIRYYDSQAPTLIIALNSEEEYKDQLMNMLYAEFIPHKAVVWRRDNDEKLFNLLPYTRTQLPLQEKTTLYVCYKGMCEKPLVNFIEMAEAIRKCSPIEAL